MTTITSTNPRPSSRFRVVRKTYVLNPKLRDEHDEKAYKITRKCELCKQELKLINFPKVYGAKVNDLTENKYGKMCKKCLSKATMRNIVYEAIERSGKSDEEKVMMKSKAIECIYVKGMDILKTKKELGLPPIPGGLGKSRLTIGKPTQAKK
jgi:CRISPR/Cas system-associated protein Cas10 (large subunit of type III CRISPR-Cas system)